MEIRELKFLTFSQGSAQPERGARPEHGEGRAAWAGQGASGKVTALPRHTEPDRPCGHVERQAREKGDWPGTG